MRQLMKRASRTSGYLLTAWISISSFASDDASAKDDRSRDGSRHARASRTHEAARGESHRARSTRGERRARGKAPRAGEGPSCNAEPPAPNACEGTPPSSPFVGNFTDAGAGAITFGAAPDITGGAFSYAAPGLSPPVIEVMSAAGSAPAFHVEVNPGTPEPESNYFGFGLYFDSCVDASAYDSVQFTVTGDLGDCAINFAPTSSENVSVNDDPRGACTLESCFPPSLPVTQTGRVTARFAELFGGSPGIISPASLIGVQWQMFSPLGAACSAAFSIEDLSFANVGPAPTDFCPAFTPTTPLLTGALDTVAAPFATYTFAAPGLSAPTVTPVYSSDSVWQSLEVTANPGAPTDPANASVGFGVPVFGCVDATAYSGVRFTIAGDLGTCELAFHIVARDNNSVLYGGACSAESCVAPSLAPIPLGTTTVLFSELTGGNPNPVLDAANLNDLGWVLTAPTGAAATPCAANLTLTDISFVP